MLPRSRPSVDGSKAATRVPRGVLGALSRLSQSGCFRYAGPVGSDKALAIAIVTVSDTRTLETDTSGGYLVEAAMAAGHRIVHRQILPDDLAGLRQCFAALVQRTDVQCVIATGGTGITARDVTPDALAPLVTKEIVGFGELFRWLSYAEIGASTIQSRAQAALCEQTLVFLLPGSTSACRLAMEKIILSQLDADTKPCNFAKLLPRL